MHQVLVVEQRNSGLDVFILWQPLNEYLGGSSIIYLAGFNLCNLKVGPRCAIHSKITHVESRVNLVSRP